jgi:hypothetical protein
VTGGGTIDVLGGIGTFGFEVQRERTGGPVSGELEYENHRTGMHIHSVAITTLSITGNLAVFTGTCRNNDRPCTFAATALDNGEPHGRDSFTISVSDGPVSGGTLRSGNIQIQLANCREDDDRDRRGSDQDRAPRRDCD